MPITYTDQFWLIDPSSPPTMGTTLSVSSFDIIDQNNNNLINRFSNDSIDGVDITSSYPGDTVTVQPPGGGRVTITGATFYLADGRVVFTPSDGSTLQTSTFISSTAVNGQGSLAITSLGPPCFVAGSGITTPKGDVDVQNLKPNDLVLDRNNTPKPLRMVLHKAFSIRDLLMNPKLYPVRIMAGALGEGLPKRDLLVSRQHRMLVSSKIAERMFGVCDVLIPAIKLTELPNIFVDENVEQVEYFHLLFDQHEVIFAEGAPTESFLTGPEALKAISAEAREEILTIFPELSDINGAFTPAQFLPDNRAQRKLIERHVKNNKIVLEQWKFPQPHNGFQQPSFVEPSKRQMI